MIDLVEDRLRRSLSAVANATPIPAVPERDTLAVVRPLRRRVVFGTAGVGIAAAVTAIAVISATAGTTESVTRPAMAVRPRATPSSPAGCTQQDYADPAAHQDLLYLPTVLPTGQRLHVSWVRTTCSDTGTDYPRLALAAWSPDHSRMTADVAVYGPDAQVGSVFLATDVQPWEIRNTTVAGLAARISDAGPSSSVLWWTAPDGGHWVAVSAGISDARLTEVASSLTVAGRTDAAASVTLPTEARRGWDDITPPDPAEHPETSFDAYYTDIATGKVLDSRGNVIGTADDMSVSVSEGDAGIYVESAAQSIVQGTVFGTWRGHRAAWNDGEGSFRWELRPGVWASIGGPMGTTRTSLKEMAASFTLTPKVPGIISAEPPSPSYSPSPPDPNAPSSPPIPSFTPAPTGFPPQPSDFAPGTRSTSSASGYFSPSP